MFCFQQCLVAYSQSEDKHLEKALVLRDAISDLPKVSNDSSPPILNYFCSAAWTFAIFSVLINYILFYRLETINLMMWWCIVLDPKQNSNDISGSTVKVNPSTETPWVCKLNINIRSSLFFNDFSFLIPFFAYAESWVSYIFSHVGGSNHATLP
jgi:hypothetical protein